MKSKSVGWLLFLLLAAGAFFVLTTLAWMVGVAWALGWLGIVWGAFFLAEFRRWVALRDVAWVAGVVYGIGVIRWFDLPVETLSGAQYWLRIGSGLLCLVFFAFIAPALLGWFADRLRPPQESGLPLEEQADPAMRRPWNDPRG